MRLRRLTPDNQWAAGLVASLPAKWQHRLMNRWQKLGKPRSKTLAAEAKARFDANTFIRQAVTVLDTVRIPLDSSNSTICDAGEAMALRCTELAGVFHEVGALRAAMERMCAAQGVKCPKRPKLKKLPSGQVVKHGGVDDGPAIARMTDSKWWRQKLREHHAQAVEKTAMALGYVHKNAEIYCSNESLFRSQQQDAANLRALENTVLVNELGQEFDIAELAAKSTSNKAIRRAELMTRISGFERVADGYKHQGVFVTITCPSRMHQWRTVNEYLTEPNPLYDGYSTPKTAQVYLGEVWKRIRAKLHRNKIYQYGFRVAEPHHDGTPHWHLLVFVEPEHVEKFQEIVWEHALRDSPDEKGARKRRVKVELMVPEKGTASGYIAKYIAKNIDGYSIEYDLYGNPAFEASQRVQAWAKTWRIKQFQPIGGPPVGVWREMRRIEELPKGAPEHLVKAHNAVNKVAVIEGRGHASVAWDHYCEAQGGVFCGRNYRIKLDMQPQEGLNRYGEEKPKRPVGVCTAGVEYVTPEWMAHIPAAKGCMARSVYWEVASKRHQWEVVGRKSKKERVCQGKNDVLYASVVSGGVGAGFLSGEGAGISAHRAPWTCVNNCTEGGNGSIGEGGSGGKSMGQSPKAHQSDGRGIHAASIGSAAGASWVELPYLGWREGDAGWLQGDELQQWKEQHMHGPWLRRPVERGAVYRIGGEYVQNGRVIGKADSLPGAVQQVRASAGGGLVRDSA